MIKFFRHIRQKLLSENKFSKYLIYAIGDHKEKQVETTILKKLITDIESDYNQLKTADSLNQSDLITISTFKNAIVKINEAVVKKMIKQKYNGARFYDINPRATTFDEMINSGKLYTLSNSELTDLCIDYYELIDKYSNNLLQIRKEYRALFYGPEMTDYWLIYLEETKDKDDYIDAFVANKESTAYKTLKQGTGWGELIMQETDREINKIKELNRSLYNLITQEIAKEN